MFILSFIVVILVFIAAFIATIAIFLNNGHKDKNIGNKKYMFTFLVIIFLISFVLRFIAVSLIASYEFTNESFVDGLIRSIELLYVTGGGLTFEGQDLGAFALKPLAAILYYGSILWLAATYLFIISLGINYELSSAARLKFLNKKKKKIYIFTSITEDTLILAKSIEEHHENKKEEEPLIIFAGYDIPPFDKDNELHRDIMAGGYIYASLFKNKNKKFMKTLVEALGLANKNSILKTLIDKRIRIFAMGNDKACYGLESKNSDDVFDDINTFFLNSLCDKDEKVSPERIASIVNLDVKDNALQTQYIDYYVLSNSTVNYEFYSKRMYDTITSFIDKKYLNYFLCYKDNKVELLEAKPQKEAGFSVFCTVYNYFLALFQIRVINEAYLAGDDLIKGRHKVEYKNIRYDISRYLSINNDRYKFAINRIADYVNNEGNNPFAVKETKYKQKADLSPEEKDLDYINRIEHIKDEKRFNTLFLGFGQTGQTVLNNLFVDTVGVEPKEGNDYDKFIPTRFVGYVYDINISQSAGVFAQTHPSYLVKRVNKNKDDMLFNYQALVDFYSKDFPGDFEEIDELTKFPLIYCYEKNCKDLDFLEDIDGSTGLLGKNAPGKLLSKINAIVIALGKDEDNINVANAILQNIRQELYHSDFSNQDIFYQTIFVNIRDEKNISRLNWHNEIEEVRHPGVNVVVFGNREKMYSYDSIISRRKYVRMNNIYDVIGSFVYNIKELDKNDAILSLDTRGVIKAEIDERNKVIGGLRSYLTLSDYKKSSNKNAASFAEYYRVYIDALGIDYLDNDKERHLWKYLSYLEHNRWSRYAMSIGYIYSNTFMKYAQDSSKSEYYDVYKEYGYLKPAEYSKDILKLHNCLIPNSYPGKEYLPVDIECYDYANVVFVPLFGIDPISK